jgi:predicted CXXCH cytochrome family protein
MRNALVIFLVLMFSTSAVALEQNLIDLHKNAAKLSNKECLNCHAKVLEEVPLNKEYKMFHRVHLESKLATPKQCTDCHQAVDLRESSAASLRKEVDPQICAGCHSGGVNGAWNLFAK